MDILEISSKKALDFIKDRDMAALDNSYVSSIQEIELAYSLSEDAFKNNKNIAKKLKYEFLLWLTGKNDIKRALEETTPKSEPFLVVVFSGKEDLKEFHPKKCGLKKMADPLALEKISLSRIKN